MAEHSDLYKKYNRIRKQIMEQVRYYGIEKPVIPTAKGLGREVQQTDIKILNTTRNFYIQPIILAKQAEKITKNKFKFNENKKSKRRLSANEVYRKYSSRFIGISQDGKVIDKVSNTELGYATDITSEEIGAYIKSTYESTNYERPITGTEVEDVFELENFIAEIQARISAAAKDMAWGQHGSQQGIDAIQNALNKFSKSDWEKAFAQYNNYVEEIRQALDQALYYSKSEEEHLRAINVAVDLLSLNKTDINFSYDDYSEVDYSDYADYQYGRPYKYTKYPVTKIEPPIYQTVEDPVYNEKANSILQKVDIVSQHQADTIYYENGQEDTLSWIPEYKNLMNYSNLVYELVKFDTEYRKGKNNTQLTLNSELPKMSDNISSIGVNKTFDTQESLGLKVMNIYDTETLLNDYETQYNKIFTPSGKIRKTFLKRNK